MVIGVRVTQYILFVQTSLNFCNRSYIYVKPFNQLIYIYLLPFTLYTVKDGCAF